MKGEDFCLSFQNSGFRWYSDLFSKIKVCLIALSNKCPLVSSHNSFDNTELKAATTWKGVIRGRSIFPDQLQMT